VKEISEIVSVDPKTQEVKTNVVFRWDPVADSYVKVNDSIKIEKLAIARGSTYEDAMRDIEDRKKVLQWMGRAQKKDFMEAAKIINMYLKEKARLFQTMGQTPGIIRTDLTKPAVAVPQAQYEQPAPQEPSGERKKRASILDLLGMKMVREK